jgi:LCP family protein required for cell wall assembly
MKLYGGTGKKRQESPKIDLSETIKLADLSELAAAEEPGDRPGAAPAEKDGDMGASVKKKKAVSAAGAAPEGGGPDSVRTKEEREEIDSLIENYQKYKKRKRIAIAAAALAVAVGVFLLYKAFVRPPDISGSGGAGAPSLTDSSGNPLAGGADASAKKYGGRKEGVYTFLLLGLDQLQANTDTIMLGRFDSVNHKLNIISIPRDTCANVKYSVKKINAVYALGGGIDALMAAMADMTGFAIDNYVMVDIEAFTVIVDTLGGVYFNIPHYMDYDDPRQNLHIHFNSGYQQLSGADAVKVVRWRQNNDGTNYGDIERIKTQQSFLMTVAKQCLSLQNLATKVDDYARIFKEYVKTNLTTGNMAWYGKELLKLKPEDITFDKIPSNYYDSIRGFSYGTILVDDWVKMVNDYLNPYEKEITASDMNIITRDANGNLYATGGEIAGGYESFLDYDEYMASLGYGKSNGSGSSSGGADTPAVTLPPATETPAPAETPAETGPGLHGDAARGNGNAG